MFANPVEYGSSIAWRRDPRSGIETDKAYFRRIPYLNRELAGDHKLIWEVNRHQHLVLLAQVFVITGSEKYLEAVQGQLEHWWNENPFQCGINWTSALEVGFRALSWIWIWHLLGTKMPDAFRERFLAELYRHGLHLEYNLSIYFSPNTHLLGEAVALHALGYLFPDFPRSAPWRATGRDIVARHMQTCVQPDGSYFEQSTYYHLYALDMFAFHAVLEDVTPSYREGLERMTEFLASITTASGDLPFLGDDDGGRFFSPYGPRSCFSRASLAAASVMLGKRFFAYSNHDLDEIGIWWLGPERCRNLPTQTFEPASRAFEEFGVATVRCGPVFALFDVGPFGPGSGGHSHSDTLSLVVSRGDQEILIDPGTYIYMDPGWRNAFRGSAAHNTVRIDGRDQAVPANPFRWSDKPEAKLLEFTSIDGKARAVGSCSYQGFTHRRTVEFINGEFTIVDEITGPDGQHDIEQFWHLADPPRQTAAGKWAIGNLAELRLEGAVLEEGWRSPTFNSKVAAPVLVVRLRTSLPVTLTARLRCAQ